MSITSAFLICLILMTTAQAQISLDQIPFGKLKKHNRRPEPTSSVGAAEAPVSLDTQLRSHCPDAVKALELLKYKIDHNEKIPQSDISDMFLGMAAASELAKRNTFNTQAIYSLLKDESENVFTQLVICYLYGNRDKDAGRIEYINKQYRIRTPGNRADLIDPPICSMCANVGLRLAEKGFIVGHLYAGYFNLMTGFNWEKAFAHYKAAYDAGSLAAAPGYAFLLGMKGRPFEDKGKADIVKAKAGKGSPIVIPLALLDEVTDSLFHKACSDGSFRAFVSGETSVALAPKIDPRFAGETCYKDLLFGMKRQDVRSRLREACAVVTDGKTLLTQDPMLRGMATLGKSTSAAENYIFGQRCYDKKYGVTVRFDESLLLEQVDVLVGPYSEERLSETDSALGSRFGSRQPPAKSDVERFFSPAAIRRSFSSGGGSVTIKDENDFLIGDLYYIYGGGRVKLRVARDIMNPTDLPSLVVIYLRSDLASKENQDRDAKRIRPSDF